MPGSHYDSDAGSSTSTTSAVTYGTCFLCEDFIDDKAQVTRCKKCKSKYHIRCSKKVEIRYDGAFAKCCDTVSRCDFFNCLSKFADKLKNDLISEYKQSFERLESDLMNDLMNKTLN